MLTGTKMLTTSIHAAFLFALVSSPLTYSLTQKIFGKFFQVTSSGVPTLAGLLLHTVVFLLVTYLTMWMHRGMAGTCGCGCGGYGRCARMYSYEDDMEDDGMDGESDFEDDDADFEDDDFEDDDADFEDDEDDIIYDKSLDMFEDEPIEDIEALKMGFTGD